MDWLLQIVENYWLELYQQLLVAVTEPKKRVFWGYLLCALGIGALWLAWQRKPLSQIFTTLLGKHIWWSASAKADYLLLFFNKLAFLFIAPVLLSQLVLATWLFQSLYELFGTRVLIGENWSDTSITLLFTTCYFLLDDCSRYWVHRWLHTVPWLWPFHKVHHSARTLTPFTVFRTHPVEGVLFSLRSTVVQASMIALFVFFFGPRADLMTVFGVGLFTFLFNVTGSNLRHSHVALRYGRWLEKWLISPAQHQIHHSVAVRHFDKNFGVVLAIWDRWGNSLVLSKADEKIEYGLSKRRLEEEHHLKILYFRPFKESFAVLKSRLALIGVSVKAK